MGPHILVNVFKEFILILCMCMSVCGRVHMRPRARGISSLR